MGWFSGKYEDERDASEANTVPDAEWREIQVRAARANHQRAKLGTAEQMKATKDGNDNYAKRWWN